MKRILSFASLAAGGTLFFCALVSAQQKSPTLSVSPQAYSVSRETVLQGTVTSFSISQTTAPAGPHVVLQTSSGAVDVHLGDASMLRANHFSLTSGDSVKIVGEALPFGSGTQFYARVIQSGNKSLTVRSVRGFPLKPVAGIKVSKQPGGAL
jgi:hypothetical protein